MLRFRGSISFLVVLMLLVGSCFTLVNLPFIEDLGLTMNASAAPFSGGNGNASNPYQISDASQLQNLSLNLSANYTLINDIDATETATWNFGSGFAPIGSSSSMFTGTLDGKGFKIYNLTVNRSGVTYCGMFGYTSSSFKLTNLTFVNPWITGRDYTGIIGFMDAGNVSFVTVLNTTISGRYVCGGLVANIEASATVRNSSSNGTVSGDRYIGGFTAYSQGTIEQCYSSCFVYNTGNYAGGFVSYNLNDNIRNCYATGDVSGDRWVGGFTGYGRTSIKYCYSSGKPSGNIEVGGFVGGAETYAHVSCFWDEDSSGTNTGWGSGTPTGITGKTYDEMKTRSTFTNAGWDFNNTWDIYEYISRPYLHSIGHDGGGGSSLNPYIIDDLLMLQAVNNDLDAVYSLAKDIDAADTYTWNWNGTAYEGFIPIGPDLNPGTAGHQGTRFTGSFNGHGKTISNLYIDRPEYDYVGLFGYIQNNPEPAPFNISILDCCITGNERVGGLAGFIYTGSDIYQCSTSGKIHGGDSVGGLIGRTRNHIRNCYTDCEVTGKSYVGGMVGYSQATNLEMKTIKNCYSHGKVTAEDNGGGLYGLFKSNLMECYSTSDVVVTASLGQAGGLVGYLAEAFARDCYATGNITGTANVGGLLGYNYYSTVENCSSSGPVSGTSNTGGFVGYNNNGVHYRSFFDTETSGTSTAVGSGSSSGITGQSTTQMMTKTTFTNAGWDFNNVWYMSSFGTRPFLRMEHNYTIHNDHQLQMMDMDLAGDYTLANDVDLSMIIEPSQMWGTSEISGPGFAPIGIFSNRFTGNFNGNDHVVNNLFINRTTQSYIGLIGFVQGANIRNVFLNDFEITGNSYVGSLVGDNSNGGIWENITCVGNVTAINQYAGSLAGASTSKITNCSSYGNVNGISNIGGLVGYTGSFGEISKSFSRVNVIGSGSYVGGLTGRNIGTISDSYTFSSVKGNDKVGGLVGENGGTISNCYSIDNVTGNTDIGGLIGINTASVSNCYWNTEISGKSLSTAGIGKTTDQMMQKSIYSGWNFADTWGIVDDFSFPYLKWQYPEPPQAVSGIAYSDFSNNIGLGKSVDLVQKGKHIMIETTYSNGFYYFLVENNTFTSTDGMIVRFVNESKEGNTVFLANNSNNMKNLKLYNNTLTVISGSGVSMNYTILEQARGFLTTGILYRAFGNKLNLLATNFLLDKDTTLKLDGNFTATIISESIFYGHLILNKNIFFNGGGFYFYNLTGGYDLNIDGGANFHENVGEISKPRNITVTSDVFFNCEIISTTGDQRYSQMGFLMKNLSLSTGVGRGNIIFEGILDSIGTPWNLALEAGTGNITFNDTVGGDLITMGDIVVNSAHDINIVKDFHAQSFTQNAGTGTTDLGLSSLNITSGPVIIKGNDVFGNITAGSLSLKVKTANLTGSINGNIGQAGADEIVLLNVIKKDTQFFDGIDLYPFDRNYETAAIEDSPYSVDYKTEYPVYSGFSWSMDSNAGAWLTFNGGTGVLSGIPTNADVGIHWVNVTVDDGEGGIDWHYFDLLVNNVAPNITTLNPTNLTKENDLYSFDFDSTDDGQGTIKWSLETSATWLTINSTTGVLSGTPTNDQLGFWWVNVTVDDGNGGTASHNYSILVNNVNDSPEITPQELEDATEDLLFELNFEASDIDPTNDTFTWLLHTNAVWLSLNSTTGILSGIPENKDVGSYWVNISVDDGNGGSHWVNFTIEVLNVNDPPTIETDIVDIATAGKSYSVDYEASDIDPTNDTLTWTLSTNASWLTINSSSGILSGTPADSDAGTYWINVTVSDGKGGTDNQNFTITVPKVPFTPPTMNNNPVITTQNVVTITEGEDYEVTYAATDDRTPVNNLIWDMSTDARWLEFDDSTKIISGTPQSSDVGSYWVNITVSDGEGGSAFTNFTLTVKKLDKPTNKNPVVTDGKMTPSSGDTDTKFTFSVIYTDPDNDPGEVYVVIDNKQQKMTPDESDTDYTDGVEYTFETTLDEGPHKFYFTASDGTDSAIAGDSTPITSDEAMTTPDIKGPGETEKEDKGPDWLMIILFIIVIVIVILLLISILGRRKGEGAVEEGSAEDFEDEEAEEPIDDSEPELDDDELDEVEEPEMDEEFDDDELDEEV